MKKWVGAIAILLCVYFDSIFFARINLYGIRPDMMLAATCSFAVLTGSVSGGVFGMLGGLLMDVLFGRMLGFNGALYLLAGLCAGYFFQKFYADNVVIPAAVAAVASLGKDVAYAVAALCYGMHFHWGWMLVGYMLPCALVSAGACMLLHLLLKPLLQRQVGRNLRHHRI